MKPMSALGQKTEVNPFHIKLRCIPESRHSVQRREWSQKGEQCDSPGGSDPRAVASAAGVQCRIESFNGGLDGVRVPVSVGSKLHRVLLHDDIPFPALPISTLLVAANDRLQCLLVGDWY
jgi:hypothetical protein